MARVLRTIAHSPRLLAAVALLNLAGTAFGIHYYWDQLLTAPLPLLPLVPDSATAVALFALALILRLTDRRTPWLDFLAGCLVATYGAWTVSVLLLAPDHYFRPIGSPWFLFNVFLIAIPHAAMVLQTGLLTLEDISTRTRATVFALLMTNWAADYGLNTHTPIPDPIVPQAAAISLLLILLTTWKLDTLARTLRKYV